MWSRGLKLGALAGALWLAGCQEGGVNPIQVEEGVDESAVGGSGAQQERGTSREEGVDLSSTGDEDIDAWVVGTRTEDLQGYVTGATPPEVAVPLGTGKPLKVGPDGAWVQGTYAVEFGAAAGQAEQAGPQREAPGQGASTP
jgi:hypothetical protein